MYDPKFRLALLICIIVIFTTIAQILYTYVFGTTGFYIKDYIKGVSLVGGSALFGFFFVWTSTKLIDFQKYVKTGFEADFNDETGTKFNFEVALSKFIPDIVANPEITADLTPIESEIIGFLNGYRHFPHDIKKPFGKSLYTYALEQHAKMRKTPGATYIHRIAALAQDLGKIYAYQETRTPYPWWMFWKQDSVSFKLRCPENGGLSNIVLATLPSFRPGVCKLPNDVRRSLLAAIRYRDFPNNMPSNISPLAFDIYEKLHVSSLKPKDFEFNPTPQEIEEFRKEVGSFLSPAILTATFNQGYWDDECYADGVYLGSGLCVFNMGKFIKNYAKFLSPKVRTAFCLWNVNEVKHPAWPFFINKIREFNILVEEIEATPAVDGLLSLSIGEFEIDDAIALIINHIDFPDIVKYLILMPEYEGDSGVIKSERVVIQELNNKVESIDSMLLDIISYTA